MRHAGTILREDLRGAGFSVSTNSLSWPLLFLRLRYDKQFQPRLRVAGMGVCFAGRTLCPTVGQRCFFGRDRWLAGFPTSFFNNHGSVPFLFISNKSFIIGSGDCVYKTRIASRRRRRQCGNLLYWFFLSLVLGVFFIVCVSLTSAPFVRLRSWSTGEKGGGGVEGILGSWEGVRNWAEPGLCSWGYMFGTVTITSGGFV